MMKSHFFVFFIYIHSTYDKSTFMRLFCKRKVLSSVYTKMSYIDLDFTISKDLKTTPTNTPLQLNKKTFILQDYLRLIPLLNELFVALNPSLPYWIRNCNFFKTIRAILNSRNWNSAKKWQPKENYLQKVRTKLDFSVMHVTGWLFIFF